MKIRYLIPFWASLVHRGFGCESERERAVTVVSSNCSIDLAAAMDASSPFNLETVVFIAPGTRGDVEPLRTVAKEIASLGLVKVRFCCHPLYHENEDNAQQPTTIADKHLSYVPISSAESNPEESRGRAGPTAKGKEAEEIWEQQLSEYDKCIRSSKLVVFNWFGTPCVHVCEKYGLPAIALWPIPWTRTSAFPSLLFSSPKMQHCGERFGFAESHIFWDKLFWSASKVPILKWRLKHHLPTCDMPLTGHFGLIRERKVPILNCFSEAVVPRPPDWPEENVITGFVRERGGLKASIPKKIISLVNVKKHVVYIGFGSACRCLEKPKEVLMLLLEAVEATFPDNSCAVLIQCNLMKNAGIKATDFKRLHIEIVAFLPYDKLLPLVGVCIHHGGAGTFASCLQAGCRQIIVPLEFDNHFWGNRAHAVGVSPKPLMVGDLKTSDVIDSLRYARSDAALAKAQSIKQRLEQEDGTDVITRKILSEMSLGI